MTRRVFLNMIVKNESPILERCLESYAQHIDGVIMYDTGSTDYTLFEAQRICGELGLEFYGVEGEPFKDFSTSRNLALQYAQRVDGWDWLLLADADMTFKGALDWRESLITFSGELCGDVLQYNGFIEYYNIRLIGREAASQAKYIGRTHEYIQLPVPPFRFHLIKFRDHADGSNRSDKYARDISLLKEDWNSTLNDFTKHRAAFYLGQTYREAGSYTESIMWYLRRWMYTEGWEEERWYAAYGLLLSCLALDQIGQSFIWYNECRHLRPGRMEPLYQLEKHYLATGNIKVAEALRTSRLGNEIPPRGLFIEPRAYQP